MQTLLLACGIKSRFLGPVKTWTYSGLTSLALTSEASCKPQCLSCAAPLAEAPALAFSLLSSVWLKHPLFEGLSGVAAIVACAVVHTVPRFPLCGSAVLLLHVLCLLCLS